MIVYGISIYVLLAKSSGRILGQAVLLDYSRASGVRDDKDPGPETNNCMDGAMPCFLFCCFDILPKNVIARFAGEEISICVFLRHLMAFSAGLHSVDLNP